MPHPASQSFVPTIVLLAMMVCPGMAQRPVTNIYLFGMTVETDRFTVHSPQMLTAHHAHGYNNQPAFFTANDVWFTSDYQDTSQTDIWMIDLGQSSLRRITRTKASEYSPTRLSDGLHFSTVVVETDSRSTQRLWAYPGRSPGSGHPIFQDITGVGYHTWLNRDTAALFIVGEPHTLHLSSPVDEMDRYLTSRIGRCLVTDPHHRLLFVQKVTDEDWYIKRYDPQFDRTEIVVKTRPGAEDFCILPDESFLMADKNVIYRYDPQRDITWRPVADLSEWGLNNIKRLAVWKDTQLLVVNESPTP